MDQCTQYQLLIYLSFCFLYSLLILWSAHSAKFDDQSRVEIRLVGKLLSRKIEFPSYSQFEQDLLLFWLLSDVEKGFYIDVGANDPYIDSDTAAFSYFGWTGILIEPQPFLCEKLKKHRPRDIVLCIGVSNAEGNMTFYQNMIASGLSTFNVSVVASWKKQFPVKQYNVSISTLSRLTANLTKHPDFMKIDVEGYERNVLLGFDFHLHPKVIMVESTYPLTSIPIYFEWEEIILNNGYEFIGSYPIDRYYVHKDYPFIKQRFLSAKELKEMMTVRKLRSPLVPDTNIHQLTH